MIDFKKEAEELFDELVEYRRYLHTVPEIGFELYETSAFVEKVLIKYNMKPKRIAKTGLVVMLGQGEKCFMIRGDMDALPINEQTGLEFASKNGNMHACGHDFHITGLLGSAIVLKKHEEKLKGRVMIVFQPAEEGAGGALAMLAEGLFEEVTPNAGLALHVYPKKLNSISSCPNYICTSSDTYIIKIKGKGCHGSAAHLGIDPINISAHVIIALQSIQTRESNPNDVTCINTCTINGGEAPNAFPNEVLLSGTIRTSKRENREYVKKRLVEIATLVCELHRGSCEVNFVNEGTNPVINDPKLYEQIIPLATEITGENSYKLISPMTVSEDFSEYTARIPAVLLWYGVGGKDEGFDHDLHNPKIIFDESALAGMSAVYANCAYKWLRDN